MDISSLLNPTASSSRVSPDPGAPEGFDIWPEPYFIEGDSGKKNLPEWLVYQGHRYRKGNDRGANPQRIRIGEEDAPGELIVRPLLDDRPIDVWLCEICHCYYKVKLSWARHLHLHISGEPEKPYICDICGASNAQQANHRSHMAQHSGEKPYECIVPECGFRSGQASNRNKHELRKHGIDRVRNHSFLLAQHPASPNDAILDDIQGSPSAEHTPLEQEPVQPSSPGIGTSRRRRSSTQTWRSTDNFVHVFPGST